MAIILAAGAALCPLQPVLAQPQGDWVDLPTSASGARLYAQAHELTAASAVTAQPAVWVKQIPAPSAGLAWREGHALYQIDCRAQTYTIRQVTLFFKDGTSQSHSNEGVVRHVAPQTSLAELVGRVCPAASTTPGKALAAASTAPAKL